MRHNLTRVTEDLKLPLVTALKPKATCRPTKVVNGKLAITFVGLTIPAALSRSADA